MVVASVLASAVAVAAERQWQQIPPELAFNFRSLAQRQRIVVSADGRYVSYVVRERPEAGYGEVLTYAAGGTPGNVIGSRLIVTEVTTGDHRTISPEGGDCWRPAFSPDSKRLAFYCNSDGAPRLWTHELATRSTRRLNAAAISVKLEAGDEPEWSLDGREIFVPVAAAGSFVVPRGAEDQAPEVPGIQVSVERSGLERSRVAETVESPAAKVRPQEPWPAWPGGSFLAAIDSHTGSMRILVAADSDPAPNVLQVSPSGKWISYVSNTVRLKPDYPPRLVNDLAVVPVIAGEPRRIASAVPTSYSQRIRGNFLWHPTREQLFWTQEGTLRFMDPGAGEAQSAPLAPELRNVAAPLAFTRDGHVLVVGTQPSLWGEPQLLVAVFLDGDEVRPLPLPAGHVFRELLVQRRGVLWQPKSDVVTALTTESTTGRTAIVQFDLSSQRSSIRWSGQADLHFAASGANHENLLGIYEDMETPADLYRFSADFSARKRVSEVEPRFTGVKLARAETFRVSVPQHDGTRTTVTSVVLLPPGAKRGERLPTLVLVYPRSSYEDQVTAFGGGEVASLPASLFTTRGYAVLLASTPIFPQGILGDESRELIEVLLPQVQMADAIGYSDIRRVAIAGLSHGGYATALITSATNTFRAGIAISGLFDLPSRAMASETMGPGGPKVVAAFEFEYGMGGHPWQDMDRYLRNSPFFRADRIRTPLLILHGEGDLYCPVEDARKMFRALRLMGRTAQYAEYAGQGHVVSQWSRAAASDAGRRIVDFLDQYVKPLADPRDEGRKK